MFWYLLFQKVINLSFRIGIFPSRLKDINVIPIFKAGNRTDATNYRPISILNSISKIYECAVSDRLEEFLNSNSILNNCQIGFPKNISPQVAITQ